MTKKEFISNLRQFLKENFDHIRAKNEKAYLYSDLKHYGVAVTPRRNYIKTYKKELVNLSKSEALDWVKTLWKDDYFEVRAVAITILNLHVDELDKFDVSLIEKMMRESGGWAFWIV